MNCQRMCDLLPLYVDGDLEDPDLEVVSGSLRRNTMGVCARRHFATPVRSPSAWRGIGQDGWWWD